MYFEKVETNFEGVTKVKWQADTTVARFTAPEWMTLAQLDAAEKAGEFELAVDKTGKEFRTKDGRPVYSILKSKVLATANTGNTSVSVRKGRYTNLQDITLTELD